jgi:N,N'-diacetyllegionaminate synthase
MKIGNKNTDEAVFVIAEIGNNHEGDFDLAREMVNQAANAGADAVKFQAIVPERLVSVKERQRIAQLEKFQFSPKQFSDLCSLAHSNGIDFMCTPFDTETVDWLNDLVPAFKIASSDNDFFPLLDRVAATGKPVVVSMGLGQHKQAEQLSRYFGEAWQRHAVAGGELGMLHCVVSYPTPDDEAGLGWIASLQLPGVTPGYSDHTIGIKAAELAVAAGARIIEKHFTVNKNHSDFRDHQLSADPGDFRQMVKAIRLAERMRGDGRLMVQKCEEANHIRVRRSLTTKTDLAAGTILTMEQLVWVRPGGGLRPGQEGSVLGKALKRTLSAGEVVLPEHVS